MSFETLWYMKVTSSKAPPQTKAIFRVIVSECPDLGLVRHSFQPSLISAFKSVKIEGSGYIGSGNVQANMPTFQMHPPEIKSFSQYNVILMLFN